MSLAATQADFMAAIRGTREDPALALYRRQALAGWRHALHAAYPVVARLVGTAFFDEFADRYAARHPSTGGDLHAYGAALASFAGEYEHARGLPWLADVARLEWAVHEAQFAAEAAAFDFTALAAVETQRQDEVVLEWHPAVRLLASPHPVVAIWEANQHDRDGTPDRIAGADRVIVARAEGVVRPHALDDAEWRLARAIARATPLAGLVEALHDQAPRLPALLQRFAAMGALAGFRLP